MDAKHEHRARSTLTSITFIQIFFQFLPCSCKNEKKFGDNSTFFNHPGLWQMFRTFVLRCDWSIARILKSTRNMNDKVNV